MANSVIYLPTKPSARLSSFEMRRSAQYSPRRSLALILQPIPVLALWRWGRPCRFVHAQGGASLRLCQMV